MKIAYILNSYPQPSHSFIRREIKALEAQGVEVLRLAMRGPQAPLKDADDLAEESRTAYVLKAGATALLMAVLRAALSRPGRFAQALALALRLARASDKGVLRHLIYLCEAAFVLHRCTDWGAQHMHAHFGTNSTAVAMLANALGGPGYSFTAHGPEEFDAPHALSLGLKLDRAVFAAGVSDFGRSQLSRWASFGSWEHLHVVHCGIEPDKFTNPAPLPEGPLRLVSIGRFVEQKGQMVLVRAMERLARDLPDVRLTLVGDGEMRGDLETAIAAAGLEDRITLTGWLDEDGVRQALAEAHALVMPSFAEGLPMVVMEAMAAARPVIATYIAGTPELVLPGKTGWLVPAGSPEALAAAVRDLQATPREQLARMGEAGRARALERHDSAAEAAKLAAHFKEASRGGSAGLPPGR